MTTFPPSSERPSAEPAANDHPPRAESRVAPLLDRYHGVFASRAHDRARLPPPPRNPDADSWSPRDPVPPRARRHRLPWAQLLRRVFFVDALRCPRCATPMTLLAFLTEPDVVTRVLAHLGLPASPPPLAPARAKDHATVLQEDVPYDDAALAGSDLDDEFTEPSSPDLAVDSDVPWHDDVADHPP